MTGVGRVNFPSTQRMQPTGQSRNLVIDISTKCPFYSKNATNYGQSRNLEIDKKSKFTFHSKNSCNWAIYIKRCRSSISVEVALSGFLAVF